MSYPAGEFGHQLETLRATVGRRSFRVTFDPPGSVFVTIPEASNMVVHRKRIIGWVQRGLVVDLGVDHPHSWRRMRLARRPR